MIMAGKRERDEKLTPEQKFILINFMEDNGNFARNRFMGSEGRKSLQGMWEVLAEQLNNVPGPKKNVGKWQKAWTSMKNKTKSKAAAIKTYRGAAGGGGPGNIVLTELDDRILAILGPEVVHSIDGSDGVPTDSMPEINKETDMRIEVIPMEPEAGPSRALQCATEISSDENISEFSEAIYSEPETDIEDSIPAPKRRKEQVHPEPSLKQFVEMNQELNKILKELVEEVKESKKERIKTNELLADIAQSLRNISSRK